MKMNDFFLAYLRYFWKLSEWTGTSKPRRRPSLHLQRRSLLQSWKIPGLQSQQLPLERTWQNHRSITHGKITKAFYNTQFFFTKIEYFAHKTKTQELNTHKSCSKEKSAKIEFWRLSSVAAKSFATNKWIQDLVWLNKVWPLILGIKRTLNVNQASSSWKFQLK